MGDLGDLRDMDVEWDMQPSEKGDEQQQQQQQISMDSDQPHAPVGTPEATPSSGQKGSEDSDFDETESITQTAFDQALETLIDDNAKEWKYLTLPEVKVEDYIVSHKEIHDDLKEHFFNPRQERVVTEEERAEFLDHMAQYNEYVVRKYNRFKTKCTGRLHLSGRSRNVGKDKFINRWYLNKFIEFLLFVCYPLRSSHIFPQI